MLHDQKELPRLEISNPQFSNVKEAMDFLLLKREADFKERSNYAFKIKTEAGEDLVEFHDHCVEEGQLYFSEQALLLDIAGSALAKSMGSTGSLSFPIGKAPTVTPGNEAKAVSLFFSGCAASKALIGNINILALVGAGGWWAWLIASVFAMPAAVFYHDSVSKLTQKIIDKIKASKKNVKDPEDARLWETIIINMEKSLRENRHPHKLKKTEERGSGYTTEEWSAKIGLGTGFGLAQLGMVIENCPADLDIPGVKHIIFFSLFVVNFFLGTDKADQLLIEYKNFFDRDPSKKAFLNTESLLLAKSFMTLRSLMDAYVEREVTQNLLKEITSQEDGPKKAKELFGKRMAVILSDLKLPDNSYLDQLHIDFPQPNESAKLRSAIAFHAKEILLHNLRNKLQNLKTNTTKAALKLIEEQINVYQEKQNEKTKNNKIINPSQPAATEMKAVAGDSKRPADERTPFAPPSAEADSGYTDDEEKQQQAVKATIDMLTQKYEYRHIFKKQSFIAENTVGTLAYTVAAAAITSNIAGVYGMLSLIIKGEYAKLLYAPAGLLSLSAFSLNLRDTREFGDELLAKCLPTISAASEEKTDSTTGEKFKKALIKMIAIAIASGASASGAYYTYAANLFDADWVSYFCAACSFLLTTTTKLPEFEKLVKETIFGCCLKQDDKVHFNKERAEYYDGQIKILLEGIDGVIAQYNQKFVKLTEDEQSDFGFEKINIKDFTKEMTDTLAKKTKKDTAEKKTKREIIYDALLTKFFDLRNQLCYLEDYYDHHRKKLPLLRHISKPVLRDVVARHEDYQGCCGFFRRRANAGVASITRSSSAAELNAFSLDP